MSIRYHYVLLTLLCWALGATELVAQPSIRTRDVVTGLDTPWEILWGPDGWLWVTQRGGRVSRIDPTTGTNQTLALITDVRETGESGLLGMALHPDFATSPFVYVVYNYTSGGGIAEKLVRYRYDGNALVAPQILLENIPGLSTHDGSRLLVTPDNKLLMTTGDAQDQPSAQRHDRIVGKILRMNLDGSPASDNPWPNAPYPTNYLWTTGHRNPQGLTRGPNGIIYSSEHGPNNDDEINIIEPGRNYGWPNVHGVCDVQGETAFCRDSNVVEPIKHWTPTTAVAGVEYYNHPAIPEWQHSLLLTNLKESDFRVLELSEDGRSIVSETILFNNQYGRLRDVAVAPDGRVFIATSNHDGRAPGGFPKQGDDRIIEISTAAAATIAAPSVIPTSLRPGESIEASFTTTGQFSVDNHFDVQLSDANGGFAAPRVIGVLMGANFGSVAMTLPCDVLPGAGYRVRIVSTDPAVTGPDNGTNIGVFESPRPEITVTGLPVICAGSSVQLGVSGGTRPRWSPAIELSCTDCENPVAMPTETRTYTVSVINELGCETSSEITLTVNPAPSPAITRYENTLTAPEGFTAYQWYRNDTLIAGATARSHEAVLNGSYAVRVTDANGCEGVSASFVVGPSGGIVDEARDRDLRITPTSATDRLAIELALGRAGDVRIELVDMRGATVRTHTEPTISRTLATTLDVSDLAAGTYLVRVTSGEESWVRTVKVE